MNTQQLASAVLLLASTEEMSVSLLSVGGGWALLKATLTPVSDAPSCSQEPDEGLGYLRCTPS